MRAIMAFCKASARPAFGLRSSSAKALVVSRTAVSE